MKAFTVDRAQAFHAEMEGIYYEAARAHNYYATRFLRMVREHGGVEAAKRLMRNPEQYGFRKLAELDALRISVEARMLRQQFRPLFTAEELAEANRRMEKMNVEP